MQEPRRLPKMSNIQKFSLGPSQNPASASSVQQSSYCGVPRRLHISNRTLWISSEWLSFRVVSPSHLLKNTRFSYSWRHAGLWNRMWSSKGSSLHLDFMQQQALLLELFVLSSLKWGTATNQSMMVRLSRRFSTPAIHFQVVYFHMCRHFVSISSKVYKIKAVVAIESRRSRALVGRKAADASKISFSKNSWHRLLHHPYELHGTSRKVLHEYATLFDTWRFSMPTPHWDVDKEKYRSVQGCNIPDVTLLKADVPPQTH